MISYDGVIRKRLRIKGHPEIPPYEPTEPVAAVPVTADVPQPPSHGGARQSDESAFDADEAQYDEVDDVEPAASSLAGVIGAREAQDNRTEAQRQHDEMLKRREKELLTKAAGKSYKEQVENFNDKLTKEPDHYDLFKTSFTK